MIFKEASFKILILTTEILPSQRVFRRIRSFLRKKTDRKISEVFVVKDLIHAFKKTFDKRA